jgi:acyl carrier protein
MDREEVRRELVQVFAQVFRQDVTLTDELAPGDVDGWDSLTHVMLVLATEKHFGIKIKAAEIVNAATVGDLIEVILDRQNT